LVNLTGTRVTEINPSSALVCRARGYADELTKARREELKVSRRRTPLGDAELTEAASLASTIRERAYEEMRLDIEAARILGKTDFEIRRALASGGLPSVEINALILGFPRMRMPQLQVEPGDPLAPEMIRRQLLMMQNRTTAQPQEQ